MLKSMGAAMVLVFVVVCLAVPASADVVDMVGVVDIQKVSLNYDRYRAQVAQLEERKAQLQTVVDAEEKEVIALLESLEAVRATAGQEEIERRREEIQNRDQELREFVMQTNIQFRNDLDSLQIQTRDQVEEVVFEIARNKKLLLVLEKGTTIYVHDTLDITDIVIRELNRRFPAEGRVPPPSTESSYTSFPPASEPAEGSGRWPFR